MHFDGNGTLYKCSNPDYQEDGMNFFIILQNLREIKSDDFGASKIGNFDNLSTSATQILREINFGDWSKTIYCDQFT